MASRKSKTKKSAGKEPAPAPKRIAWDRVSFLIPANWEIGLYKFLKKGVTRIEVEDEYAVRLEAEWIRPRRPLQMRNIMKRYERASRELTLKADERKGIEPLPHDWYATHYIFRETVPAASGGKGLEIKRHDLVTAFYLCPRSELFGFFILHFLPGDPEDPVRTMRLIAREFRHHKGRGLVPWRLFDIAFEVPHDFVLENTQFDVGAKLMVFRWKLRRFYLWVFSCADMFLKDGVVMEEWVAGYLNGFAHIYGPAFHPGANGAIEWKRRRKWWVAHRDEIARWCYRYKARCRRDEETNQLIAWVFNYRRHDDLHVIPEAFRFGPDIFA
ncbi:MAG: hypothetical protein JXR37_13240 [Kiritimatiellae bacterium]|nr:hypothetical protein [Kiritimatiellia bacterium]